MMEKKTDMLERLEHQICREAAAFVRSRLDTMSAVGASGHHLGDALLPGGNCQNTGFGMREKLLEALRRERNKARSGSARYDFNRHLALHQALRSLDAKADTGAMKGQKML